jgi:hypothetical protein
VSDGSPSDQLEEFKLVLRRPIEPARLTGQLGTNLHLPGRVYRARGHQLVEISIRGGRLEVRGLLLGGRATQLAGRRLTHAGICSLSCRLF